MANMYGDCLLSSHVYIKLRFSAVVEKINGSKDIWLVIFEDDDCERQTM